MENERIKLEIDRPLFLDDPHRFWMVTSGQVDVFCVAVDENNEFTTSLKYLYSAKKGELLFSLLTEQQKSGYKLYIKSQGASLFAVDKSKLLSVDHYFSGPAAKNYMEEDKFAKEKIKVEYWDYSGYPEYEQLHPPFEHGVSILDLLFASGDKAKDYLKYL